MKKNVKKNVLVLAAMMAVMATSAMAWWLIGYQEVMTCFDSDSGLNFTTAGSIWGISLNGTSYFMNDTCSGSDNLKEYACSIQGNKTYAALVGQNCSNLGLTCVNGTCV